jgi:hypothetical protein
MQIKRGFVLLCDGCDDVWERAGCSKIVKGWAGLMYLCWSSGSNFTRLFAGSRIKITYEDKQLSSMKETCYFNYCFSFIITVIGLLKMSQELCPYCLVYIMLFSCYLPLP